MFHSPYHVRCHGIPHRARKNEVYKDEKTQSEKLGSAYALVSTDCYYLTLSEHHCDGFASKPCTDI